MTVVRWLVGTVGVVLAVVLLVLGVILSPVLLLLAPIPIAIYLAWKFWRLRRKTERGIGRQRKKVGKATKKVTKKAKKRLG
jgi:hypothetical protein